MAEFFGLRVLLVGFNEELENGGRIAKLAKRPSFQQVPRCLILSYKSLRVLASSAFSTAG